MLHDRYKENRLIKHMHSKKITDSHALDLLAQLLALDPNKRIKAEDAIGVYISAAVTSWNFRS